MFLNVCGRAIPYIIPCSLNVVLPVDLPCSLSPSIFIANMWASDFSTAVVCAVNVLLMEV